MEQPSTRRSYVLAAPRRGRRGLSGRTLFVVGSLIAHAALGLAIGGIEVRRLAAATAIEIAETRKAPPPPAKLDAPPPETKKEEPRTRRAAPAAKPAAAPEPVAAKAAAVDALPDFGLSLSGAVSGTGPALPSGSSLRSPTTNSQPVVRRALAETSAKPGECADPPTKPRPKSVPQPTYTENARAANVEGKVRVELTVDESGRVVSVRLLSGLGYGLDEAALAAARRAEFEPALRCGKPARATFTISMRFTSS